MQLSEVHEILKLYGIEQETDDNFDHLYWSVNTDTRHIFYVVYKKAEEELRFKIGSNGVYTYNPLYAWKRVEFIGYCEKLVREAEEYRKENFI